MEVILLENVRKLGTVGSTVKVKDGFARNFLIPRKLALRATKENKTFFEQKRAHIEQENQTKMHLAEKIAKKLEGFSLELNRQASEDGKLFGSISARDIAIAISAKDIEIDRQHVIIDAPIKYIGSYQVLIGLHSDVEVNITVNVVRSEIDKKH